MHRAEPLRIVLTVHVEVVPGTVLMLVGRSVEEHHLTLVPALVALLDAGEVEGREAVVGTRQHAGRTALVMVVVVRGVVVVPDVHGHIESLGRGQIGQSNNQHASFLCLYLLRLFSNRKVERVTFLF